MGRIQHLQAGIPLGTASSQVVTNVLYGTLVVLGTNTAQSVKNTEKAAAVQRIVRFGLPITFFVCQNKPAS